MLHGVALNTRAQPTYRRADETCVRIIKVNTAKSILSNVIAKNVKNFFRAYFNLKFHKNDLSRIKSRKKKK